MLSGTTKLQKPQPTNANALDLDVTTDNLIVLASFIRSNMQHQAIKIQLKSAKAQPTFN